MIETLAPDRPRLVDRRLALPELEDAFDRQRAGAGAGAAGDRVLGALAARS